MFRHMVKREKVMEDKENNYADVWVLVVWNEQQVFSLLCSSNSELSRFWLSVGWIYSPNVGANSPNVGAILRVL